MQQNVEHFATFRFACRQPQLFRKSGDLIQITGDDEQRGFKLALQTDQRVT